MITYEILKDKSLIFQKDGIPFLSVNDSEELIELGKVITKAKFAYCKKFKCSLDGAECS